MYCDQPVLSLHALRPHVLRLHLQRMAVFAARQRDPPKRPILCKSSTRELRVPCQLRKEFRQPGKASDVDAGVRDYCRVQGHPLQVIKWTVMAMFPPSPITWSPDSNLQRGY